MKRILAAMGLGVFFGLAMALVSATSVQAFYSFGAWNPAPPGGVSIEPTLPSPEWRPLGMTVGMEVGWAITPGEATLRFDTNAGDVFNLIGHQAPIPVEGIVLGLHSRLAVTSRLGLRFDASELLGNKILSFTSSRLTGGGAGRDFDFDTVWRTFDAGVGLSPLPMVTLLAGCRYELLDSHLWNTVDIPGYSSFWDECDITWTNIHPYAGLEFVLGGPLNNLTVTGIGLPWVHSYMQYRATFGTGGVVGLEPIRDDTDDFINGGYFYQVNAVGRLAHAYGSLGGFARWNVLNKDSDVDFESYATATNRMESEPFSVNFSRRSVVFGGFLAINF
jgi:opacity protein-like surface antigen